MAQICKVEPHSLVCTSVSLPTGQPECEAQSRGVGVNRISSLSAQSVRGGYLRAARDEGCLVDRKICQEDALDFWILKSIHLQ